MKKYYMIGFTTLTCLLAGIAGVAPSLKAAGEGTSVSKLLAEAKTQAYAGSAARIVPGEKGSRGVFRIEGTSV